MTRPARMWKSVDLPQPVGPTMATNSFSAALSSIPASTGSGRLSWSRNAWWIPASATFGAGSEGSAPRALPLSADSATNAVRSHPSLGRPVLGRSEESTAGRGARATAGRGSGRQNQLEAGAAAGAVLVDEVAAVGVRVRLRDREPEARAVAGVAALEALEQAGDELLGDALAGVLDDDAEVAVAVIGADDDRRLAVAERIREQIRQDPLEREPVGEDGETRLDQDVDVELRSVGDGCRHVPHERLQHERLAVDLDRLRVEA